MVNVCIPCKSATSIFVRLHQAAPTPGGLHACMHAFSTDRPPSPGGLPACKQYRPASPSWRGCCMHACSSNHLHQAGGSCMHVAPATFIQGGSTYRPPSPSRWGLHAVLAAMARTSTSGADMLTAELKACKLHQSGFMKAARSFQDSGGAHRCGRAYQSNLHLIAYIAAPRQSLLFSRSKSVADRYLSST